MKLNVTLEFEGEREQAASAAIGAGDLLLFRLDRELGSRVLHLLAVNGLKSEVLKVPAAAVEEAYQAGKDEQAS